MGWYSNLTTCFAMLEQNKRKFRKTTSLLSMHYAEVGDIQQGLGLPGKVSL